MKISIGIVDDHQLFLKSLCMMLQSFNNYDVIIEAANGKDLQEKISFKKTIPEIMLIDVNMPVMDGITTLPEIRKNYPNIKVIILSMHNDVLIISKLLKNGAHSYLLKDSDPSTIYSTIKSCYMSDVPVN